MKLGLWGSNDKALSVSAGAAENTNCYLMQNSSGRNGLYLTGVMGSTLHATLNAESEASVRGMWELDDVGYVVAFTSLFKVETDGTVTTLGSVPGGTNVSMTDDGTSIMIVNGTTTAYYYNTNTESFSTVTMPFEGYTVTYIDSYVFVSSTGQTFFRSDVGDIFTFNALNFEQAQRKQDDLLTVREDHAEVILFGTESVEFWFNTGNADFAFERNPSGIIDRGLYARFATVQEDNSTFFLGDDLVVYRINGYQAIRVSTDDLDIKLANLRDEGYQTDLSNATMFSYTEHGHKFVQLNIPNRLSQTLNLATGEWFTSKHFDYETSIAVHYIRLDSRHFVGGLDGKIYEWKRTLYSDNGRPLKRGRKSQFFSNEDKRMSWRSIKLIANFGETPVIDGTQGTVPQLVLRWSDDEGRTFKNEIFLPLGENGKYTRQTKAVKRACGASRNRMIEFYVTDPVPFLLVDAVAEVV